MAALDANELSDELFHNVGVGMDAAEPDLGREDHTGKTNHRGAFKTPALRSSRRPAPTMHDGSMQTLMEVVEHFDKGGTPNEPLFDKLFNLNLTEQEKLDLVAFMEEALDSKTVRVKTGNLPR